MDKPRPGKTTFMIMVSPLPGKYWWFPLLCKSFKFDWSHLFIFAFISFAFGDRSRIILLQFMSKSVLPMFSSRSFVVSGFTFRFLMQFEFVFVCAVKKCSNHILSCVAVQFSQHDLLRRLSFLLCIFSPLLL